MAMYVAGAMTYSDYLVIGGLSLILLSTGYFFRADVAERYLRKVSGLEKKPSE